MMTSDPKLIRNILIRDFNAFRLIPTLVTPADHPVYGNVIDNTGDAIWLRIRSVIRTLFTDKKLRLLVKKVEYNLMDLTNALDGLVGQTSINIKKVFINQSIDLMANVMFSWKQNSFVDTNNKFNQLIKRLLFPSKYRILANLVLPKFMLQFLNLSNIIPTNGLNKFADLTVEELDKRKSLTTDINEDFFQWMLNRCTEFIGNTDNNKTIETTESDQMMSKDEVMANIFALFYGAFETHYTYMTFIIYELAVNPECQQKVYEEIMTCYRDSHNNSRTAIDGQLFDWESLVKLDYLNACISETMRLHAAVIREERIAKQDYTDETTGLIIKKDHMIQISRTAVQRCPDYYEMPDQFIPDRFLKQNKHQLVDSAFLPFGLGRRMCPGYRFGLMAIKLTMAHLLLRYKFVKLNNNQTKC
ncbi:cytochrome P450 9c1-like [Oppia nitens]|uniref:cytochrome P450 9c1-like n=1 Tax=Oppia nitens TaxID=1686743 RepID=UPI0023D9DA21|nr:cytochrome P450 9c1-like [Oppia nitens]